MAHAFDENIPRKDLLVTADHRILLDHAFIPVRMLINDRTIFYDREIDEYDYYHFETAHHAIIHVNNLATESYLDSGNRAQFTVQNKIKSDDAMTEKNLWDVHSAAPLRVDRQFVEALHARLDERARAISNRSPQTRDIKGNVVDIALRTPRGKALKLRHRNGQWRIYDLPAGTNALHLASASSRPCDAIGPHVDDRRKLGVLIGAIEIFHLDSRTVFSKHIEEDILEGWSNREDTYCRWTTGQAYLPLPPRGWPTASLIAVQVISKGAYN